MAERPVIVNRAQERATLKVISKGLPASRTLLNKLDESYFANTVNKTVFRRIKQQIQKRNAIPSWRDLIHDPSFDQTTVTALKGFSDNIVVNRQTCTELFDSLHTMRRRRILHEMSEKINTELLKTNSGGADDLEDSLIAFASNKIALARAPKNHEPPMAIGKGSRYKERLENLLSGKAMPMWPTGFTDFDSRSGGLAVPSLVLIGGYTASGKGYLSGTLANNFADYGLRVGEFSLEMDDDEILLRRASALSNTLQDKILKAEKEPLTEKEKQHIRDHLAKKANEWARKNAGIYTHSPKRGVGMDYVLSLSEMYDYNVTILDYASLMEGVSGDRQFEKLGEICRVSKLDAKNRKAVNIILIQTDKADNVKFSNSMLMHCDYAFQIVHSDTRDEDMFSEITLPKVRKISARPFVIGRDLAYARFTNYNGDYKPGDKMKTTTDKPIRVSGSKDQGVPRQQVKTEVDEELESYFADTPLEGK